MRRYPTLLLALLCTILLSHSPAKSGESVDLQTTTDQGGRYNVGWTAGGEWLQYTIDVRESTSYKLQLRLASNGGGGDLHVEIDGTQVDKLTNLRDTGGYEAWQTISIGTIPLETGEHTVGLVMDRNGRNNTVANFNFIQRSSRSTRPSTCP